MEKTVLNFEDFLNEELNLNTFEDGSCKFSERWFYYNLDDDIIYGSDEKPVLDDYILFAFNPGSRTIPWDWQGQNYAVNNPICLSH